MGNWYYPNGTEVPRPNRNYYNHFYRTGYTHQVRLGHPNDVFGPLGSYTCSVPDQQGHIWNASIFIIGIALNYVLINACLKLRYDNFSIGSTLQLYR